jgi:glycosyltransferase involved in cell wall biosynthesis
MRIAYVSTSRIPSRAANGIQTMRMCAAFAALGHQVTLFTRGAAGAADPFGFYGVAPGFRIEPRRWPGVPGGGLWYGHEVRRALAAGGPWDLVYARAVYGAAAALRLGVPVVLEVHAPPASLPRRLLEERVLRSPLLRRLVTISDALRREYLRLFPWIAGRVETVVAHDAAEPDPPAAAPLEAWPGRDGALQVGYVGHLYPGKGAELVVEVARGVPEADFHLVGGTEADLARLRADAGDAPNLFFHGFVPPARVPAYHARFGAVLLPAGRRVQVGGGGDIAPWMSPLKLFEYMGGGKPLVASDLPVLREVLRDGENALLAAPDQPAQWAEAIRALARDPARGRRLAERARADFLAGYTWRARAERVVADV